MKKIIAVVIALAIMASSTVAFAWWDRLNQETGDQDLNMGYGVRLVLENETTSGQGVLVPTGSFYASVEGYTTEYVFVYELFLEEDLDNFDLLINLNNLTIGGVEYNTAANVHGPLSVKIETSVGEFVSEGYDSTIEKADSNLRINEVLREDESVYITLRFTLQNNVEDAAFAGDLVEAYKALAGQIIEFDMTFEVPSYEEQTNQMSFNVHPGR